MNNTLENLKQLMGTEIDANNIICCFETEEEIIISKQHNGHYQVYEDAENSTIYVLEMLNNVIVDIREV